MLYEQMSEECIELLVASLFLSARPYDAPARPHTGFMRFLHKISTFDFTEEPVVINANGGLTAELLADINKSFRGHRDALPAIAIFTEEVGFSAFNLQSEFICSGA